MKLILSPFSWTVLSWKIVFILRCCRWISVPLHRAILRTLRSDHDLIICYWSYCKGQTAHRWAQTVFFSVHHSLCCKHAPQEKTLPGPRRTTALAFFQPSEGAGEVARKCSEDVEKKKVNLLPSLQGCDWCDIGPFNFISVVLKTCGVPIQMKLFLQNICKVLFISQGFTKMIMMNSAGNFFFDLCYEAK